MIDFELRGVRNPQTELTIQEQDPPLCFTPPLCKTHLPAMFVHMKTRRPWLQELSGKTSLCASHDMKHEIISVACRNQKKL